MNDLANTISCLGENITTLNDNIFSLKQQIKHQIEESEKLRFRLSQLENSIENN